MFHRASRRWFASAMSVISVLVTFVPIAVGVEVPFEYDANGNLISGEGKYYEYNDANQLVRVRHGNATGPVLAEYGYDPTGQRVKKIVDGVKTYHVGPHFEVVITGDGSNQESYYFRGEERVARRGSEDGLLYFHSDHLGSFDSLTDSAGTSTGAARYFPFGERRRELPGKYSFGGKELDDVANLYYFGARYYSPQFAAFTQADPIRVEPYAPQSLNRYSYSRGNPISFTDPTGHEIRYVNERDKQKFEKYFAQLRKTPTGRAVLSRLEKIAGERNIYLRFTKNLRASGNEVNGLMSPFEEDGVTAYSVQVNEKLQNEWFFGEQAVSTLGHELQHVVQWDQAGRQGYPQDSEHAKRLTPAMENESELVEREIEIELPNYIFDLEAYIYNREKTKVLESAE